MRISDWSSDVCASDLQSLVYRWEQLLGRIPLVRSIYNSVKQVSDTVLAPDGQAFREAVLVQYTRHGAWTIAFLTGAPGGEVDDTLGRDYVSVYVPTTPNPTSGFFLMMPRQDVQDLDMTVDEELKYICSLWLVVSGIFNGVQDGDDGASVVKAH